jgi:thioredoxin 1
MSAPNANSGQCPPPITRLFKHFWYMKQRQRRGCLFQFIMKKNKEVYLMSVQKLNQNNFNNAIANGTTLVDFYADWCGPCRMVSPIVDEIAEERNDITVGKVNVDDENALAMKYSVMSIPTLIVFQDGKEKTRIVGARPKAAILAELV